ncbi:MAG: YeeE/YedE family protein [Vicinamibacterales bacterium]|nr:YeeE/YedE family protein [Vicinamibacterales bacterium]
MTSSATSAHWRAYVMVAAIVLVALTVAAVITRTWVLTAIPVGVLFGFFLQKGALCGASALSEVVVFKDRAKLGGIWIAIAVSMVGFAGIEAAGWVQLAPKPLIWLSALVGGLVFGAGTVLAGGCISGCLFKAAEGNLNSMAGLGGIAMGVAIVETGPLRSVHLAMMSNVLKTADGKPVTLASLTGLPFWLLALLIAGATVAVVLWMRRRHTPSRLQPDATPKPFLTRAWKPWQAGLAIGLLAVPAYLSSVATGRNYPLGVTHGVLQGYQVLTETHVKHVWRAPTTPAPAPTPAPEPAARPAAPPPPPAKVINWWLVSVVLALPLGSWASARLSGPVKLLPRPPEQTVIAFFGGALVGIGAAFATGCVVGNILSGWALMSVGMLIFGVATALGNWAMTYIYMMGWTPFER